MTPGALLLLLLLTDGTSCQKVCSYQDVIDHLNLTRRSDVFTLTRPVLDHTHRTVVKLDIILYAILAVIEKTQTFIPFIWVIMKWNNEFISWDPSRFCGITRVSLPKKKLWIPDLFIYEMTEKDDAPQSPYVYVDHDGTVTLEDDLRVVSTCKMDVHKFPFDTQSCNITIGSAIHSVDEVQLVPFSNSSRATQFSREVMKTQGEWDFLNLTVSSNSFNFEHGDWENLIYTITMKRRPLLHIINFLLPILFFLCLDLASFFISDHRGEKLGFKVTVLLAISVLLLILNEILPAMSNKTPLIATYCIVIFALMLLNLLETILVTHLMEKDSPTQESCRLRDNCEGKQGESKTHFCDREEKRDNHCVCVCDMPGGDTPCELLPMAEQVGSGRPAGECGVLLLILEELRRLQRSQALLLSGTMDGGTPGYWTRAATKINTLFFIFYVVTVSLFLIFMCIEWSS
ncbi:5-hydroxytryptamine receptor 3A-like [Myripristis murdjan]|uniref:5-hydroxytryptamine receptor 3A-like n=1 Tax=Myripristis murdjan TaxID=586833 RepID=UPI00117649FA|nr:5-hydroxytryptamine receptor 3A-like [Myripristis murdjan]